MSSMKLREVNSGWNCPSDMLDLANARPCQLPADLTESGDHSDIGAVILTVNGGGDSYDNLFDVVPQKGPSGTRTAVYTTPYSDLANVLAALQDDMDDGESDARTSGVYSRLAGDVRDVEPSAIVLNLECCGCCSEAGFSLGRYGAGERPREGQKKALWSMIDWFVGRGSFIMASDFSLKALIKEWQYDVLGPNPFVQRPQGCSTSFELAFDPAELVAANCGHQLQTVGRLCTDGKSTVNAMGGTITYCLTNEGHRAATAAGVMVQLLTRVEKVDGMTQKQALAGHVLLTLPSGGKLLTSMGHWVELAKLSVTKESLLAAAELERGSAHAMLIAAELKAANGKSDEAAVLQRRAAELVKSAPPCARAGAAVANAAGGVSIALDESSRLLRFLVLGTDQGSYYTSGAAATADALSALLKLMLEQEKGLEAVRLITEVSNQGRAPKQTPTLTALAICCQLGDPATKKAAYAALPRICRIPTHLFEFLDCCEAVAKSAKSGSSGWGRAHRRAIQAWYNEKRPAALAEAVTKYKSRQGWSHLDVLRLCHATPSSAAHATIFRYVVKGLDAAKAAATEPATPSKMVAEGGMKRERDDCSPAAADAVVVYLDAVEQAAALGKGLQAAADAEKEVAAASQPGLLGDGFQRLGHSPDSAAAVAEARCVELIRDHGLRREHIPSQLLSSKHIWEALLQSMPLGAMVRSLGKLGAIGLLTPGSDAAAGIVTRLADAHAIRGARLHPMALLFAQRTYSSGHGERGSLSWTPAPEVVKVLDVAFASAFGAVKPAGKRFAVAIDVSDSMKSTTVGGGGGAGGSGSQLTCEEAAAAMALVLSRTEPNVETYAFAETYRPVPALSNGGGMGEGVPGECLTVPEAIASVKEAGSRGCGGTDCSLPMRHATLSGRTFDTFVVFTDNETWAGDGTSASEALCQYRACTHGVADAKLIVVGMASNGFTVADPTDAGQLDCVGFDAATPSIIAAFAAGQC